MRQTVIHVPSFEGEYKTALLFSMVEGLKQGEGFKFVCDQNPSELETLLREAKVPNLEWKSKSAKGGQWELDITKRLPHEAAGVGCCGVCGTNPKR